MDFRDNNRFTSPEVVSLNRPSAATRRHQGAKCFFSTHGGEEEEEGIVNNSVDDFLSILMTHQLLSFYPVDTRIVIMAFISF